MVAKIKTEEQTTKKHSGHVVFETQFIAPTASHYYSTIFAGYTTRYRRISQHITDPFCLVVYYTPKMASS